MNKRTTSMLGDSEDNTKSAKIPRKGTTQSIPPNAFYPSTQEDDDDDSISIQAMLEHLKKVNQKKTSKTKEKLQNSVETAFNHVENILIDAMEDEANRYKKSVSSIAGEFNKLQHFLQRWIKDVQTANETYALAMRKLGEQMDQAVSISIDKMETSIQDMVGVDQKERQDNIIRDVQEAVSNLKNEIRQKPSSGGVSSKALPLLMQALMSQDI